MALMQFKRIASVAAAPEPKQFSSADAVVEKILDIAQGIISSSEPYPIPGYGPEVKIPKKPPSKPKLDSSLTLYNDSDSGIGYKVWSIERMKKTVTTRWGKEGATMQSNSKTYITEPEAINTMLAIIRTKRLKGYRETK
jgi:predicted DNA-binding WGR domain protein